MSEKKSNVKRYRNFASVVYPESAPEDWIFSLSDACVPVFISPLHHKDENPDGSPKKPHYHVLLMYDGVHTVDQAREYFELCGGVGCEVVNSLRGYARYLCHLDNPEKYQYSPEDVTAFGGACYTDVIGLPTDKYKMLREMIEFCVDNYCDSFSQLAEYAMVERPDWFRTLCDNGSVFMREYLKSRSWTRTRASLDK